MTDKQEPWDHGVFKGADGLRKLVDSQPFWDEQSYGTRLYFGPNITDYLHRDVLRAAVEHLERAAPPAQPDHQGHSCTHKCTWPQCEAAKQEQRPQRLPLVQATAPREIWLEISDEQDDNGEPFPDDTEGITWCQDSALTCEVKYVRADLAAQPAPAQEPQPVSNTDELPQRLSDERIMHFWDIHAGMPTEKYPLNYKDVRAFARAIEAAIVPPGYVVVPVQSLRRWRDAFAEELAGYDIDPPIHHVKTSHDEINTVIEAAPKASHDPR